MSFISGPAIKSVSAEPVNRQKPLSNEELKRFDQTIDDGAEVAKTVLKAGAVVGAKVATQLGALALAEAGCAVPPAVVNVAAAGSVACSHKALDGCIPLVTAAAKETLRDPQGGCLRASCIAVLSG